MWESHPNNMGTVSPQDYGAEAELTDQQTNPQECDLLENPYYRAAGMLVFRQSLSIL